MRSSSITTSGGAVATPATIGEILDLQQAAHLMHLGLKAMKELVDSGAVPATCLNQKHTAILREDLIAYLREEGRQQANARRILKLRAATSVARPRRGKRSLPDLDRYDPVS